MENETLAREYKEVAEMTWHRDKQFVKGLLPFAPIRNEGLPSNHDRYILSDIQRMVLRSPPMPYEITESSVKEIVDDIVPRIEDIWKEKFPELPKIEIVPPERMLSRLNELEEETNAVRGYGKLTEVPPSISMNLYHGKILIPEQFLMITETEDKYITTGRQWEKTCLEAELCNMLSGSLHKQLRKEWGSNYPGAFQTVGLAAETQSSLINKALQVYTLEKVAMTSKPELALQAINDKLRTAWPQSNEDLLRGINEIGLMQPIIENYYGVAMGEMLGKTLAQIAMVDSIEIRPGGMSYGFNDKHPNHEAKHSYYSRKA